MTIYLEINADENRNFFAFYDALSPLRKKIWNKIAWACRKWPHVNPSQSKIAKWCGCSRSAVSEAFRLFQDYGWMSLKSRGWKKSKTIQIPLSKLQIDVKEKCYFRYVKATHEATLTSFTKIKTTSTKPTRDIPIRNQLKDKNIPLDVKLKLSMVSERTYQEALFQCKKKAKMGFKPLDEARYLFGVCVGIAKQKKEKLDWVSYYNTFGKLNEQAYAL